MNDNHRVNLQAAARESMLEHGFRPDFSTAVQKEVQSFRGHTEASRTRDARDLRGLLWSSIDNDTSRDLDQIEFIEDTHDGTARIKIAIADVDAYVPAGSAIDKHA